MYDLVGGKAEKGETLHAAVARETFEEIGVVVNPENLEFIHVLHRKDIDELVVFFFVTTEWSGEPFNKEPHKHDDLRWFPLDQLPQNIIPGASNVIKSITQNHYYSHYGF